MKQRIVIEMYGSKIKSEKDAVFAFRDWMNKLKFRPHGIHYWGIKQFNKVHAAENIKKRKAK